MIYMHHNFYSNFTGSVKSGDLSMTSDILINEISDFIVHDTKKIVATLNTAKVKVSEEDADEEIVDAIIANINTNPNVAPALAFIIAEANELVNIGTPDKPKWTKIVNSISEGVLNVGKGISSNRLAFKEDLMQSIKTKADSKGDYKRTVFTKDKASSKAMWWILGSLGAIALTLFVISRVQKYHLKNGLVMADGGGLPNLGAPAIQPINPLTPVNIAPVAPPIAPVAPPVSIPVQPLAPPIATAMQAQTIGGM